MSLEHVSQAFTRLRPELPGTGEIQAARTRALERLVADGWPTRKLPHWHYSSIPTVGKDPAARFGPGAVTDVPVDTRLNDTTPSFVLNAGALQIASDVAAPGLAIESLGEAWRNGQSAFGDHAEPLVNLNTAFAADGAWIRATGATHQSEPLYGLIVDATAADGITQNRIRIELAPRAELALLLHFGGTGEGWNNTVIELELGEGAKLALTRLQTHADSHHHSCYSKATLAAGARLSYGCFELGSSFVHNDLRVDLNGNGASTHLYGLFVAGSGQHLDTHVDVNHHVPETYSQQEFRGIAATGGRGIYNGGVRVAKGAQRIEAHQKSDNLLLGPRAEIDTKPELEIYADDVKCSHGATVGELDADAIYYLRSRGLDLETARELLTLAFAESLLERVPNALVQDAVRAAIAQTIGETRG